tara:strand:- start:500 stop:2419 length:1920 start_codon:yes stop_codon:yes gene_type:complete
MKKIIFSTFFILSVEFGNLYGYGREILLEGFEENIDNVIAATDADSRGANGNVKLTHFNRTDAKEPWVTQGERALQIEFINDQKYWSVDFIIHLNPKATAELQEAWNADPESGLKPEARYVLKYDVTFPENGLVHWINQTVNNHWEPAREFNTPHSNDAPVVAEIPLDLIEGDLVVNDDGTASFRFIHNADWADGNVPKLFIDNIRLVDQWDTEKPPSTVVIESFEDNIQSVEAASDRVVVQQYTLSSIDDSNATHGSKSLKVILGQPEGYSADWHIDLSKSELLKELMRLPSDQRMRYVFRFDIIFQERPVDGWGGGNWGYKFSTTFSPSDTARMPNNHSTYSVNLGLIEPDRAHHHLDPDSPRITFYGNGGYSGEVVAYFDNFRILDTKQVPDIVINSSRISNSGFSFDWNSTPGSSYRVDRRSSLNSTWNIIAKNYPDNGASSEKISFTDTDIIAKAFYRVAETPAPPIFFDDFESGAPGWVTSDLGESGTKWELGKPTSGPGEAHSSTRAYGTGLANDYDEDTDVYLISPVIDLTGQDSARLEFWSYRDCEPAVEGEFYDWCQVMILDENDEYLVDDPIWLSGGEAKQWRLEKAKIPTQALGQKIKLEFNFSSDDVQDKGPQAGWFIDDVAIKSE